MIQYSLASWEDLIILSCVGKTRALDLLYVVSVNTHCQHQSLDLLNAGTAQQSITKLEWLRGGHHSSIKFDLRFSLATHVQVTHATSPNCWHTLSVNKSVANLNKVLSPHKSELKEISPTVVVQYIGSSKPGLIFSKWSASSISMNFHSTWIWSNSVWWYYDLSLFIPCLLSQQTFCQLLFVIFVSQELTTIICHWQQL